MVKKQSSLPPIEECSIEFVPLPDEPRSKRIFRQVVGFPKKLIKVLYHTYLLARHAELREPIAKSGCPMRWIGQFPSLVYSATVTGNPVMMKAIVKQARKDPEQGLFDDQMTEQLFLPVLRDLFPSETVSYNDFFLTAHKNFINRYRQPVLQFIGAQNIKRHSEELEKVARDTVDAWSEKSKEGKINASELSFVFTTNVISRLLLGHPGPAKVYGDIAQAIHCINQRMMKQSFWKKGPSKKEKEEYDQALETIRQAINTSMTTLDKPALGSLVDAMREEKEMSELQIKTTLFMMYLGGSESTGSLLSYLLWQLGRNPDYQEQLFQEITSLEGTLFEKASSSSLMDKLFAESIRLLTPVYIMGRYPKTDLLCVVKDKEGKTVFQERIAKKGGILNMPTFAARDPERFENPDVFNPHRFETSKGLSWLPFGDGKHSCPGQWLTKAEVTVLVTELLRRFTIQSFPEKEVGQKGGLTLKTKEEIWLTLTARA